MRPEPLPTSAAAPVVAGHRVSAGLLVSQAFSTWWQNLFRFAAVTLVLYLPVAIAVLAVAGLTVPDHPDRALALFFSAAFPITFLTLLAHAGALAFGAVQHLGGRPVRIGAMLGAGLRRLLPLAGAALLAWALVVLGILALLVPGIIAALALAVVFPVVVVERLGPVAALRRSFALTRGRRLALLAAGLVLLMSTIALNAVGQLGVILAMSSRTPAGAVVAVAFSAAMNLLASALPGVLPAVAYHQLRVEKEGIAGPELLRVFE